MLKKVLFSFAILFGVQASALTIEVPILNAADMQQMIQDQVGVQGLPWKVGESANYNLKAGFISGKMTMLIREEVHEGFWVEQNVDVMIQKSKVELLIDKNTGKILQMIVDGKKQTPPEPGDTEILESHPDNVTVPAGTFECAYVKVHDKKQNQDQDLWVNPELIPVMGMIKTTGQTQLGALLIELTSFVKK